MEGINKFISENLKNRIDTNSLRTLKQENDLIDFCSNDYLGFAHSIEFKLMFEDELKRYPNYQMGSGGSRLLAGNDRFTEDLENEIAEFHLAEQSLIFNSGYDANIGLFSSIPQRGDTILSDEYIHASIIDGIRLSHATRFVFKGSLNNSIIENPIISPSRSLSEHIITSSAFLISFLKNSICFFLIELSIIVYVGLKLFSITMSFNDDIVRKCPYVATHL